MTIKKGIISKFISYLMLCGIVGTYFGNINAISEEKNSEKFSKSFKESKESLRKQLESLHRQKNTKLFGVVKDMLNNVSGSYQSIKSLDLLKDALLFNKSDKELVDIVSEYEKLLKKEQKNIKFNKNNSKKPVLPQKSILKKNCSDNGSSVSDESTVNSKDNNSKHVTFCNVIKVKEYNPDETISNKISYIKLYDCPLNGKKNTRNMPNGPFTFKMEKKKIN